MINKLEKFIYKWFVKSDKFHSLWFIGQVTPGVFALLIQPGKLAKKKKLFSFSMLTDFFKLLISLNVLFAHAGTKF